MTIIGFLPPLAPPALLEEEEEKKIALNDRQGKESHADNEQGALSSGNQSEGCLDADSCRGLDNLGLSCTHSLGASLPEAFCHVSALVARV